MQKNIYVICIFLLMNLSFSQENYTFKVYGLNLVQGNVIQDLAGNGYLGSTNASINNLSSSNPAAIYNLNKNAIGFSFQYGTKIDKVWFSETSVRKTDSYLPQSLGILFSFFNFKVGLGSNQIYNLRFYFNELEGVKIYNSDLDTIETRTINSYKEELIIKNSLIFAKDILNIKNMQLLLGAQINYNYMNLKENSALMKSSYPYTAELHNLNVDIYTPNFSIGIKYKIKDTFCKLFSIASYYESSMKFEKWERNIGINDFKYYNYFPNSIHNGMFFGFENNFSLIINSSLYLWYLESKNTSRKLEYKLSVSGLYALNNLFSFSSGILMTDQIYDEETTEILNLKLFGTYLMLGTNINIDNFIIDFVIADSHLLSDSKRKQTVFKFGLGYTLF